MNNLDWNEINVNDLSTYPENNQDILCWDDYKGYVICSHYNQEFEDSNGNKLTQVLGWVPIPEPMKSKNKFISR